jgi:ATP/maltotriose-dependent transcriptional regulator MalT/DNA-binding SARP family transcriptional activator
MALAKTTQPTAARVLPRPRLFRRLDRGRTRPVVWVWGPPGAGKTTLVASYAAARRLRTLWYRVDEGDRDLATFFYYLGRAAPPRRRPLPLLTPEFRQGVEVFARRFFRELCGRLRPPFTVVFDNYQDAGSDSPLHEVMAAALEEIPDGGSVVIVSRSEPPPAFARHRARRMIGLLDASELRFTPAESAGLIRKLAPGRWSRPAVRALHESVDGWAAGLVLRLNEARVERPPAPGPAASSSEVLFDYFAGEVFKTTDPVTQEVLLQTAFLPRLTATMAQALTGQAATGDVLAALHRQNYFIDRRRDDGEPAYEYHPLFREFLMAQARRTYPPEVRAKLRRTAAGLVEAAGRMDEAAGLLHEAEDWEGLALLVHRHAQTLLEQGRGATLEQWLDRLPPRLFGEQPWLLFWRGIGWMAWRHHDCQRNLETAFTAFRQRGDTLGMFLAWAGVVFAYVSEGQHRPLDHWIGLLEDVMRDTPEFPTRGVETRVACAMLVAVSARQPHHPRAADWAERAIALCRRHPDLALRTTTAVSWLIHQHQRGALAEAAAVFDEMRALMQSRDVSPVMAVNAAMTVAWYETLTANPSYRRTVARMLELAQTTGMFYTARHVVLGAGLMGALSDGDLATAAAWLGELERDVDLLGPGFRFWRHWFVVWDALLRNDATRAAGYQPEMLRLSRVSGRPLDEAAADVMSAQVLHLRGDERMARDHVDRALQIAQASQSPFVEFMARLTEAQLGLDGGRDADGLRALAAAMRLGRAHSFVTSQVWVPSVVARLCVRALEAGIEVDYVRDLVKRRRLVPDTPPVEVEAWPWPVKVFTLGRLLVVRNDQPLCSAGKVQRKPLALLKALIVLGSPGVREERLMDALWPDAEGHHARRALTSTVHRLRRLLGHEAAVVRHDSEIGLDPTRCWVDVWAVTRLLDRAETTLASRDGTDAGAQAAECIERAARLYRGPLLGAEDDVAWSGGPADRLRRRLVRLTLTVVGQGEQAGDWERAADGLETALRIDPAAEDGYRRLMVAYHRLGRPADVQAAYRRCREALAEQAGTRPSAATQALLAELQPRS